MGIQGEEMRGKDRDGNMLVGRNSVRHSWVEYFENLLNV